MTRAPELGNRVARDAPRAPARVLSTIRIVPSKYPLPDPLIGLCSAEAYARWLHRKAVAHCRRDRARRNLTATIESYKAAIHAAVARDGAVDAYTGEPLRWDLISTYSNDESSAGGRVYKKSLAALPTVDHVGDGLGAPDFRICSWRTNDAKNDLSLDEFVDLCEAVVRHRRAQP